MKRLAIVLMLITFLSVVGCSDGDGDGGQNLTGTWNWIRTFTNEVCDWGAEDTLSSQIVVNQSGTKLVVRDPGGSTYEGTVQGINVTIMGSKDGVQGNWNGTIISDNRVEFNGSFTRGQCILEFKEEWNKVSDTLAFYVGGLPRSGDFKTHAWFIRVQRN